jgi:hypothetical protein
VGLPGIALPYDRENEVEILLKTTASPLVTSGQNPTKVEEFLPETR